MDDFNKSDLDAVQPSHSDGGDSGPKDKLTNEVGDKIPVTNSTSRVVTASAAAGAAAGVTAVVGKPKASIAKIAGAAAGSGLLFALLGLGAGWFLRNGEITNLKDDIAELNEKIETTPELTDEDVTNELPLEEGPLNATDRESGDEEVLGNSDFNIEAIGLNFEYPEGWGVASVKKEDGWLNQDSFGVIDPDGVYAYEVTFANREDIFVKIPSNKLSHPPRGVSYLDSRAYFYSPGQDSEIFQNTNDTYLIKKTGTADTTGRIDTYINGQTKLLGNSEYTVLNIGFLQTDDVFQDEESTVSSIKELLTSASIE